MSRWPRDNQSELIKFYGTPGPEVERQLVPVIPPFRMTYEGKPIKAIQFHKKAATALAAALKEIWEHYGRDQKKIDALGISRYAGAYNCRKVRGSATKWSNHAFGAAIDLNAEENGLYAKGNIPQPVINAFKRQGARWGGDYKGRKDPMHFEFCDNGSSASLPPPPDIERIQPEDGAQAEPKSMASSKIGNAQIAAGTVTTVAAGAQVAKPFMETTTETIAAVNDVATQTGNIVETTKVVTTSVPDTVWTKIVHALASPEFIACAVLVVIAVAGMTWYWRRQHRQAGV